MTRPSPSPALARPAGSTWTLALDGWTPPSVNQLLGLHWSKHRRLKRGVADAVKVARMLAPTPVPDARGRRRVSVAITVSGRSGLVDPDNVLKVLLDACVVNDLLVDDSDRWCEVGVISVVRGEATRTVIQLEDMPS